MIINYILSNSLKEITFLIKNNSEYKSEYLEQLIFNKINENSLKSNNYRIFYVRVNKKRFDYDLYICIYLLNDEQEEKDEKEDVEWKFIINIIEKIFECKSIEF